MYFLCKEQWKSELLLNLNLVVLQLFPSYRSCDLPITFGKLRLAAKSYFKEDYKKHIIRLIFSVKANWPSRSYHRLVFSVNVKWGHKCIKNAKSWQLLSTDVWVFHQPLELLNVVYICNAVYLWKRQRIKREVEWLLKVLRTKFKSEAKKPCLNKIFSGGVFEDEHDLKKWRPNHEPFDSFPSDYDQALKANRMNIWGYRVFGSVKQFRSGLSCSRPGYR